MNIGKFDELFKVLLEYKWEMNTNNNIPDKLKCLKCKGILINACQVRCGCQYCHDCVNKMIENGVERCPGNTDDCKDEYLSNNQFDYRANTDISKLIVKCPEEICLFECELIKMGEHLRICGKKSMTCPFADFGCENRKMESETLNEHCQSSNLNHYKILLEMIDNIKNEMDLLKNKEVTNEVKIEQLEEQLKVKCEEIKTMKLENENLKRKFENMKENLEGKTKENSKSINGMEERIDYYGSLLTGWTIGNLVERKNKDEIVESEYFTSMVKQYKMRLVFWADGRHDFKGKGCSIFLRIYSDVNDDFLSWPFKSDVTIKIVNKENPNINESITKYCEIEKPPKNSCISSFYSNPPVQFDYKYLNLVTSGVMADNCFDVECFLDFK